MTRYLYLCIFYFNIWKEQCRELLWSVCYELFSSVGREDFQWFDTGVVHVIRLKADLRLSKHYLDFLGIQFLLIPLMEYGVSQCLKTIFDVTVLNNFVSNMDRGFDEGHLTLLTTATNQARAADSPPHMI